MPSLRNRWGQSGDVLGRLRPENHENLEIYPSLGLLREAGADLGLRRLNLHGGRLCHTFRRPEIFKCIQIFAYVSINIFLVR